MSTGAVARRDADAYRTAAIGAEQAAVRAQALLSVAERQASVTRAKRATLEAALQKAEAQQLRAQAALDLAFQDRRHATLFAAVTAPSATGRCGLAIMSSPAQGC